MFRNATRADLADVERLRKADRLPTVGVAMSADVQRSAEFAEACPASTTVMALDLSRKA